MSPTSRRVRCEDVRELLPEYAEPGPRPAGPVELHLASCPGCRADLAAYRSLLSSLESIRDGEIAAPEGYLERSLHVARVEALRGKVRSATDVRAASARVGEAVRRHSTGLRYVLATLGGAAAGATAIALVWWSLGRRTIGPAPL